MLLSIHKGKTDEINLKKCRTDEINLKNVPNVFCEMNEERRRAFCIFCDTDFLQLNND